MKEPGTCFQSGDMTGLGSEGDRATANEVTVYTFFADDARNVLDSFQRKPEHAGSAFGAKATFQLLHLRLVPRQYETAVAATGSPPHGVLLQHGGVQSEPGQRPGRGQTGVAP